MPPEIPFEKMVLEALSEIKQILKDIFSKLDRLEGTLSQRDE